MNRQGRYANKWEPEDYKILCRAADQFLRRVDRLDMSPRDMEMEVSGACWGADKQSYERAHDAIEFAGRLAPEEERWVWKYFSGYPHNPRRMAEAVLEPAAVDVLGGSNAIMAHEMDRYLADGHLSARRRNAVTEAVVLQAAWYYSLLAYGTQRSSTDELRGFWEKLWTGIGLDFDDVLSGRWVAWGRHQLQLPYTDVAEPVASARVITAAAHAATSGTPAPMGRLPDTGATTTRTPMEMSPHAAERDHGEAASALRKRLPIMLVLLVGAAALIAVLVLNRRRLDK